MMKWMTYTLWGMEAQAQVSHLIIRCNLYSIQSIPVHTKDAWRIWIIINRLRKQSFTIKVQFNRTVAKIFSLYKGLLVCVCLCCVMLI